MMRVWRWCLGKGRYCSLVGWMIPPDCFLSTALAAMRIKRSAFHGLGTRAAGSGVFLIQIADSIEFPLLFCVSDQHAV